MRKSLPFFRQGHTKRGENRQKPMILFVRIYLFFYTVCDILLLEGGAFICLTMKWKKKCFGELLVI